MPRFSLKHLLTSTTLICAGLGALAYLSGIENWNILQIGLWLATGPVIGCGLLTPIRRPGLGFAIGSLIQLLIFCHNDGFKTLAFRRIL
jgi:hypothetical protein